MKSPLEAAYEAILAFVANAREPAAIEPGDAPIPLTTGSYTIAFEDGRLTLEAWGRDRNLVRRITHLNQTTPGALLLTIERWGKRTGTLQIVDLAKASGTSAKQKAQRETFRERFRRSLLRQFAGWEIETLSAAPDLEHSLSPAYPRAFLTRANRGLAAIAAPPDSPDPDGALAFGLVWLNYLRTRERKRTVEGLVVFIPEEKFENTVLRILHLDPNAAHWEVFMFGDGFEERLDLHNSGNILTELPPVTQSEAARFDVRLRQETFRPFSTSTRSHSKAGSSPEALFESKIRKNINEVDVSLLSRHVYGQVPAIAGTHRGVIDLLACDLAGRLAVVELKVTEDLQLPLQALDYWLRVKWHLERREFSQKGYFPGVELTTHAPRMLLVAPALHFHPTTEILLRYFPPSIEVERIGLAASWREEIKVVFRAKGSESYG